VLDAGLVVPSKVAAELSRYELSLTPTPRLVHGDGSCFTAFPAEGGSPDCWELLKIDRLDTVGIDSENNFDALGLDAEVSVVETVLPPLAVSSFFGVPLVSFDFGVGVRLAGSTHCGASMPSRSDIAWLRHTGASGSGLSRESMADCIAKELFGLRRIVIFDHLKPAWRVPIIGFTV
jgi:hypothetical protein